MGEARQRMPAEAGSGSGQPRSRYARPAVSGESAQCRGTAQRASSPVGSGPGPRRERARAPLRPPAATSRVTGPLQPAPAANTAPMRPPPGARPRTPPTRPPPGIPKFYRWLSERYPLLNMSVAATEAPPEIDNLYLDMNGIIHNCTHANDPNLKLTETEMVVRIFTYLDKLIQIIKPQRLVFMAIDGACDLRAAVCVVCVGPSPCAGLSMLLSQLAARGQRHGQLKHAGGVQQRAAPGALKAAAADARLHPHIVLAPQASRRAPR